MSTSVRGLLPIQQVVKPPEVENDTTAKYFVGGTRTASSVSAGGGQTFGSGGSRTMTFTIPPLSSQWIDLNTLYLSFLHTPTGNMVLDADAGSIIQNITVSTMGGLTLSSIDNYGELLTLLADVNMDDGLRNANFSLGFGGDETRRARKPDGSLDNTGLARRYQVHLLGTIFSMPNKYLRPSAFQGLSVRITLKDAPSAHHATTGTVPSPTYTISEARLDFDTIELPPLVAEMVAREELTKPQYYSFQSFTYSTQSVPESSVMASLQIPSRSLSKNYVLVAFQDADLVNRADVTTTPVTGTRTHAGLSTWQFEVNGVRIPQVPATRLEAFTHLKDALSHNIRGILNFQNYVIDGTKFALGRDLRISHSLPSGDTASASTARDIVLHINRKGGLGVGEEPASAPTLKNVVMHAWVAHDVIVAIDQGMVTVTM